MFTRIQSSSAIHVFDAPLLRIPPDMPGAMFMGAIGGAYENEEEHLRSRLLQFATDLEAALTQPDRSTRPGVQSFLISLRSAIEFLESFDENSVRLYSYERPPSINELLDAFADGGGADDWALEEFRKKGEKGCKALLAVLKKEGDKRRIMSAISMLLIFFRNARTTAAIQRYIDTCDPDTGKDVSLLLVAYNSQ